MSTSVSTSGPVTSTTDTFAARVRGWEAFGAAYSFGTLEMDCWDVEIERLTTEAARAGLPCWLALQHPDSAPPTDPAAEDHVLAVRPGSRDVEPWQVLGVLVLDPAGQVRDAVEVVGV